MKVNVNKISNLSNLTLVNVPFVCVGGKDGKGSTSACQYD